MNEISAEPRAQESAASARDPHHCPACRSGALDVFFEQRDVPVTSNASFRALFFGMVLTMV